MYNKPYKGRILILGFGSIGRAALPCFFSFFDIQSSQVVILADDDSHSKSAQKYDVTFHRIKITSRNYIEVLNRFISDGDFLVNLTNQVCTASLVKYCDDKKVLYIDTSTQPWEEHFNSQSKSIVERTRYMFREHMLELKGRTAKTALITHGANPGLVSHFVKQALCDIADANGLHLSTPETPKDWASLSMTLGIKAIHISERDTQVCNRPKHSGEFVNTWSVEGLIQEGLQPAELGWGTHEKNIPVDGKLHEIGSQCGIYLNCPGAHTKVRSWVPSYGAFHGLMIPHSESMSLANYLTLKDQHNVLYRPTVHYAYQPSPDAILSLLELADKEWAKQESSRLIFEEIIEGADELGVLLMGNSKGAYWYGSNLSIQEARALAPFNNATSMQVVAGLISGMMWVIDHPDKGLLEPEEIDYQYILNIAKPYLGSVKGYFTDWNPIHHRTNLYHEIIDPTDPWVFDNIRIK